LNRGRPASIAAGAFTRGHQRDAGTQARKSSDPVACVIRAKSYDEALANRPRHRFGSPPALVPQPEIRSHFRQQRAGMVMVNLPPAGVDYHVAVRRPPRLQYGARRTGILRKGEKGNLHQRSRPAYTYRADLEGRRAGAGGGTNRRTAAESSIHQAHRARQCRQSWRMIRPPAGARFACGLTLCAFVAAGSQGPRW